MASENQNRREISFENTSTIALKIYTRSLHQNNLFWINIGLSEKDVSSEEDDNQGTMLVVFFQEIFPAFYYD